VVGAQSVRLSLRENLYNLDNSTVFIYIDKDGRFVSANEVYAVYTIPSSGLTLISKDTFQIKKPLLI
jgi:cytochrome oxidase Cu insertion factor (SCO1/SenC/PrrC family)